MGLVRKSSKLAITSMIIAGMMMSSCGDNGSGGNSGGIGHWFHEAWDWLTGKPPRWRKEQADKNSKAVANWQQTLSKVNIKALPKELKQCFETASQLSGVPLPVLYAIGLKETGLDPHDNHVMANDGLGGRNWDCGIMQVNTLSTICPLANRLAHNMHIFKIGPGFGRHHAQLLAEIKALGLKYIGGGSGAWCDNLTHDEAVKYCREVSLSPVRMTYNIGTSRHPVYHLMKNYDLGSPLTSNAACLSVFMGAYELAYDMWWQTYDSNHYKFVLDKMKSDKDSAYEDALKNAGPYFQWVLVAYQYNGIVSCSGIKCYFDKFARNLHGILSGTINIGKKLL
ncbi:MAG: hypothetical protein RXO36_02445 [Candidatus Nanopusillus acidilobi]